MRKRVQVASEMAQLNGVRGANYVPAEVWNAYQQWANYDEARTNRDLGFAKRLGLDSLRVWLSYEWWREQAEAFDLGETAGNAHIGNLEHFLTQCANQGIKPVLILFESPPQGDPALVDLNTYQYGVHSPSRSEILQPRNWKGYKFSPMHFTRRMANSFGDDSRVLAWEIMNEPANVQPRKDFAFDMLDEFDANTTSATITMGTKDTEFAQIYDQYNQLDVWQFHSNLKPDAQTQRDYIQTNVSRTAKPVWCTEWQRTLAEPPHRGLPYYQSLASTMHDERDNGLLAGDFFWDLMFSPAYLSNPRNGVGRTNGIWHPDGTVFNLEDAEAIAGGPLAVGERTEYPTEWASLWDFPDPSELDELEGDNPVDSPGFTVEPSHVLAGSAIAWALTREDK